MPLIKSSKRFLLSRSLWASSIMTEWETPFTEERKKIGTSND